MKYINRIIVFSLLVAMSLNLFPLSSYATGTAVSPTALCETSCSGQISEMGSLEFSEAEIEQLYIWHERLSCATSALEIDALMNEYDRLVEGTSLETTSVATSLYTSTGGTLILDYTGQLNPFSNVITTKVVYFTAEEVVFLQEAIGSVTLWDFIKSELVAKGIELITPSIADVIAKEIRVPVKAVRFLIGHSISFLIFMLENFDAMDLSDAISRSTTAKVKLEFFYLQSVTEPYYQSFENFEPWNSNYIDIPENYDYKWFPDIYDYDSSIHEHYMEYASNSNGTHTAVCGLCNGNSSTENCNYNGFTAVNSIRHRATCKDCGYVYTESHSWNANRTMCLVCGYDINEPVELKVIGVTHVHQ